MVDLLPKDQNALIHGRTVIVPLEAVPAEVVDSGSPRHGVLEFSGLGGIETGIWEMRDGVARDTEVDEIFIVISGGASIELLDERRTVEVKTGDVMRLVAGTRTRWSVPDHIRKVYLTVAEAE